MKPQAKAALFAVVALVAAYLAVQSFRAGRPAAAPPAGAK